jgi:hypothetical protein
MWTVRMDPYLQVCTSCPVQQGEVRGTYRTFHTAVLGEYGFAVAGIHALFGTRALRQG